VDRCQFATRVSVEISLQKRTKLGDAQTCNACFNICAKSEHDASQTAPSSSSPAWERSSNGGSGPQQRRRCGGLKRVAGMPMAPTLSGQRLLHSPHVAVVAAVVDRWHHTSNGFVEEVGESLPSCRTIFDANMEGLWSVRGVRVPSMMAQFVNHSLRHASSAANPCVVWPLVSTRQLWMHMQHFLVGFTGLSLASQSRHGEQCLAVGNGSVAREWATVTALWVGFEGVELNFGRRSGGLAQLPRNAHDCVQQRRRKLASTNRAAK